MKLVKRVLLALLFSLLVGFAIGTLLRWRLERPVHYIGQLLNDPSDPTPVAATITLLESL